MMIILKQSSKAAEHVSTPPITNNAGSYPHAQAHYDNKRTPSTQ